MAEALALQGPTIPAAEMGSQAVDLGDSFINRNAVTALNTGNVAVNGGRYNKLKRTAAAVLAGLACATSIDLLKPASAEGSSDITYGTPVVTTTTHFSQKVAEVVGNTNLTQVEGALAGASQESSANVTFMSYIRANGTPKKYKLKEKGADCKWVEGGWNSGRTVNDKVHPKTLNDVSWFYDPRTTRICKVPKNVSPSGWMKIGNPGAGGKKPGAKLIHDCGNFWKDKMPKAKHIIKTPVILFKNSLNVDLIAKAKSKIGAAVSCANPNNLLNRATASFEASGSGSAKISLRQLLRTRGKGSLVSKASGRAIVDAKASASGFAAVTCGEDKTPPVVPVCTDTLPAVICYPKTDGPNGAGNGITNVNNGGSVIGGPGQPGQPGNTTTADTTGAKVGNCLDSNSAVDGDANIATPVDPNQPATLYGAYDTRTGYCIGKADAPANP